MFPILKLFKANLKFNCLIVSSFLLSKKIQFKISIKKCDLIFVLLMLINKYCK